MTLLDTAYLRVILLNSWYDKFTGRNPANREYGSSYDGDKSVQGF
ncbi:MAG: hypothetical protein P4L50_30130 [Anaerolineaceae bacterium]|nr:hypothetical protein [Anaerolineaceae bacterium]